MSDFGKLYIVATPIGNLEDLSPRAKRILGEVDLVVCEDTRVTKKILSHFDIRVPTDSLHQHSSKKKHQRILKKLQAGESVALTTDAGTPAVSDPGMRLVKEARAVGAEVVSVPGPSAVTAALSVSGLPADSFIFLGFVPKKKGRKAFFNDLKTTEQTTVFFESPHRIEKTLKALTEVLEEEREVVVARELTKAYETVVSGSAFEVKDYFQEHNDEVRGEFTVVVSSA